MKRELDLRACGCRVIAARVDALKDDRVFAEKLSCASEYRRRKVLAYRFEKDRCLSLLAGVLLDELLHDRGLRECDMVYVEGENGKPAFADCEGLHFSLAHSGAMAVAALAEAPIGVDVEYLPGFPRDIAEPYEWTTMESVGKLLGSGVGEFVDSGEFHIPDGVVAEHVKIGDHLVCIARETGLPL